MRTITQRMDREAAAPILLAAALTVGAVGLELFGDLQVPPPAADHGAAFALAMPPSAARRMPVGSRLTKPSAERAGAVSKGPMSFNEFIDVARKATPKPVAEKFVDEFLGEPPLLDELTEFERARGGDAPASEFLGRMLRRPEFASLVSSFRSDAGFQEAFAAIARDPRAADVLRGVGSASSTAATGRPRRARGARAVAWSSSAAGPRPGAVARLTAASPAAQAPGAGRPASAGTRPELPGTTDATVTPAAPVPEIGATREAAAGPSASLGSFVSGPALEGASCDTQSLFASAPKDLRAILDRECESKGICDPLQSCGTAGVLDRCAAVASAERGCESLLGSRGSDRSPAPAPAPDTKVTPVVPAAPEKARRLDVDPAPAPVVPETPKKSFWRELAEGLGGMIGRGVGFVVGLIRRPDWPGVLGDADAGAAKGVEIADAVVDAVGGFFRNLF
ncbi:MAG: hypothetical protein HY553_08760 [Elusimicrobia bacterium]|nr:hypothetical protein [Elusimicrobiota bacterium]